MTTPELCKALEEAIKEDIQGFEEATGLHVNCVNVSHMFGELTVNVLVGAPLETEE